MDRESLGVYQLKRLLGRGGMGAVYLAHDSRLARDVALKLLSPDLVDAPGFRDRFLAEARSCSRLNHPNITTIHEIGRVDDVDFIAFEHVEGDSLETILRRDGGLPVGRAIELAVQIASALAHAHERGVIHRDLKPANVIVTPLGIPKVLDFGLAKVFPAAVSSEGDTLARLTQAGMIVGTFAYMAPEQALGEGVDARSDIFAFGCLLYEMLAGVPAFRGATPAQVLDRLLRGDPEPLDRVRVDVDAELAKTVGRALSKKPEERYQSMDELGATLRAWMLPREGAPASGPQRGRRSIPRPLLAAAAVAALAVSTALLVDFIRGPASRDAPRGIGVMYFDNLSDPRDSDRTGSMLSELLTTELAASPELSVVSRQRLHDVARGLGEARPVDREIATGVARAASVGTMVVGQVALAGDRLMASVELVDVATGRSLSSERAEVSSSDDIFELAQSLGDGVRARIREREGEGAPETGDGASETLTGSVDAYRHYVEGELALHASKLDEAVEELQQAVLIDPAFSLAQFRLSMAARWLSDGPTAHQAARRAAASLDRAPSHMKEIVQANALYQDGAYSQALPLLRTVLSRDPEQKEALYLLGQIYMHSLRDGDTARAIELMERLLVLDPRFHQIYDRLALGYSFEGDFDSARRRLGEWAAIRPDKVEGLRSILATFEGEPEETLGFGQAFSWIEGPLIHASAAMMASRWELARGLVEHDAEEYRSDHLRAWALRNRAVFHTYVGEFEQAVEYYRRAGMASGLRTDEGAGGGVPASALQTLAELYQLTGETGAARAEADRALAVQPESWRGLYYAGRMALLDEDLESGARHLETLRRVPAVGSSASARVYLAALEGEMALASGDAARARELFEPLVRASRESLMLDWASTCSSAGAAIRDGLVRTYLALGRSSDAMKELEAILASGAERIDHPVLYTQALYRLGIMKLESGRVEEGRRLLSRYLAQWEDSDWELPSVAEARKRLSD
jgi:serine/threonine protein kinase/tetratricopeptide (TPR) repeat protein